MLRPYFRFDRKLMTDFSRAANRAAVKFIQQKAGKEITPAMVVVKHTYGEGVRFHPHLHTLPAAGGWDEERVWHTLPAWNQSAIRELFQIEVFRFLREKELLTRERMEMILSWRHSGFNVHISEASRAQWRMRVHEGGDITEFEVSGIDSITFYQDDGGFVYITADTFTMGSPTDEPERYSDETLHLVTLTNDFYMSETEITNQQYAEIAQWAYDNGHCTATSSSLKDNLDGSTVELLDMDVSGCEISFSGGTFTVDSGKEDHPVKALSWCGAASYCDWLSMNTGLTRAYEHSTWECNGHDPYNAEGFRLPTEAEWEYACRAGTHTPFNTGNCLDAGTEANYEGNYPYTGCPSGPYEGWTVGVGSYPDNSFDLYDMHGNVYEWCNDWYGSYSGDETDPVGPASGTSRVIRGGCWSVAARNCRSAVRNWYYPANAGDYYGFRVCRGAGAR